MKTRFSTSGFTLVEMVIATTIFTVMSIAVISVYIQVTELTYRLKATRYISETAREITEKISTDVRENGLSGTVRVEGSPYWNGTYGYTNSGSEILGIGDGSVYYIYGKKGNSPPYLLPCVGDLKIDMKVHCGLYRVVNNDFAGAFNLVDSFIPEEDKKRVKIRDIKFYVSGNGVSTENKVTLVMDLILLPRIGVPGNDFSESSLRVQTTISERFYR